MNPDELRGRHFTTSAERVVQHIVERASDRNMAAGELSENTAGMLAVLSILRWERKVAVGVLENLGADLDRFARELDAAIEDEGRSSRRPGGPEFVALPAGRWGIIVDWDTPCRPLLDQAEHEALALGHGWVGTEHLLLAAVRFACPRFQEVLARHGVEYDKVRREVLDVLASDPPEV
jgi:ATP-dependent Clp protease ATP-binding subunit ClpA